MTHFICPGLQNTTGLQFEDFQQPGVRSSPVAVSEPGFRGRVSANTDVHHQNELRQGLGGRIQAADSDLDAMLDRTTPQRASAVAGPGPHSNGLALAALLVNVLNSQSYGKFQKKTQKAINRIKVCGFST